MTSQKPAQNPPRSRGRPKLDEVGDIDKRLLDVALEEFLEHGYGGASLSRMVRTAGISKTTLYTRFASKEAIFHALIDSQIEKLSPADLLSGNAGPLTLAEGLRRYAYHMLDVSMAREILGVNRLMFSEAYRFPELGQAAARRTQLGVKRIRQFIEACAVAESFTCSDPEALAEIFILAIRGWYIDAMVTNRKVSQSERNAWVDRTVAALFDSLST